MKWYESGFLPLDYIFSLFYTLAETNVNISKIRGFCCYCYMNVVLLANENLTQLFKIFIMRTQSVPYLLLKICWAPLSLWLLLRRFSISQMLILDTRWIELAYCAYENWLQTYCAVAPEIFSISVQQQQQQQSKTLQEFIGFRTVCGVVIVVVVASTIQTISLVYHMENYFCTQTMAAKPISKINWFFFCLNWSCRRIRKTAFEINKAIIESHRMFCLLLFLFF